MQEHQEAQAHHGVDINADKSGTTYEEPPPVYQEPLPPGWEQRLNAEGRPFYVNHDTKVTQWTKPYYNPAEVKSESAPIPKKVEEKVVPVPHYDAYKSASEVKEVLHTRGIVAEVISVCRKNLLLTILSLALWGVLADALINMTFGGAFMIVYFLYFGFFVFFAGYFPPCLLNTLKGGPCIHEAPHGTLGRPYNTMEAVSQGVSEIPGFRGKIKMHVTCSHTTSTGSGKNRRTVTVVSYRDEQEFKTTHSEDKSDDAKEWIAALNTDTSNLYYVDYVYSFEMANESMVKELQEAKTKYQALNAFRDTSCSVSAQLELPRTQTSGLMSKHGVCLAKLWLNRITLGIMSYGGLLLIYLIVYAIITKRVTYHSKKVFSCSTTTASI